MADMHMGITIEGLRKRYGSGDTAVDALKGVDMQVSPGEVVGLVGHQAQGKVHCSSVWVPSSNLQPDA